MLGDPNLKLTYLIIDALDECVQDMPKLLKFIVEKLALFPNVKWIVLSRNWTEIGDQLNMATHGANLSLGLNTKSVTTAVNAYIWYKVN